MPNLIKTIFALLIASVMSLSIYALPIAIVYLLFVDTKSTLEILLFAVAEYCILFAIFGCVHLLLEHQRTKTITQILLTILFIAVAVQFVKSAPSGCITSKYIDCD